MGKSSKQTVGYKYYIGAHLGLCHGPVDEVSQIEIGDKIAWTGSITSNGTASINQPKLFGGDDREGGIVGDVDFAFGAPAQTNNTYLDTVLTAPVPAFRGIVSAILNQVYIGTSPYLKPWGITVTRVHTLTGSGDTQWYDAKAEPVSGDINPAHVIRECLTNTEWGMGYPTAEIDDTEFQAAADTLYTEGFGLSFAWSRSSPIEDFIEEVLRHIDGIVRINHATGKFELYLLRNDYTLGNLTTLDESNVTEVNDIAVRQLGEVVNSVTVRYKDEFDNDASVTADDPALIDIVGTKIEEEFDYIGIRGNPTLAAKIAQRELKQVSLPLISCSVITNRDASSLRVGDPFILTWPENNISEVVMRVVKISLGNGSRNRIKIECVQDAFDGQNYTTITNQTTQWTDPASAPVAVAETKAFEVPYYVLARQSGQSNVDDELTLDSTIGYASATARASGFAINSRIWLDDGSGYDEKGLMEFPPYGVLAADFNRASAGSLVTTCTFSSADTEGVEAGDYALCGNEWLEVVSVSDSGATFARGCMDTHPEDHSLGDTVYFLQDFVATVPDQYVDSESLDIKVLPQNGAGVLDIGDATAATLVMDQRANRPYPPAKVSLDTEYFPEVVSGSSTIALAWAHRDRTQQTAGLNDWLEGDIGPESTVTYEWTLIRDDTLATLDSATGLTGTSDTITPGYSGEVTLTMKSVRGGVDSFQTLSHSFYFTSTGTVLQDEEGNYLTDEEGNYLLAE